MIDGYHIPAEEHRVEIVVGKSRFITTVRYVETVDEAKASHHVYAYRLGYGNSITEGLSDDGEPTGTPGPPAMAVLRGHDIGDVIVVITRYFGGRKLGKGGLVRALSSPAWEGFSLTLCERGAIGGKIIRSMRMCCACSLTWELE